MPTSRGLRHAIVLATLIAGSPARGQELHEFDTDRDAFTPATRPVAVGHVLTEASYSFIDNRGTPATNSFPELLIRRGATERFEWRLGFNYESGSGGSVVTAVEGGEGVEGDELASESSILYGFKTPVTEQGGWAPRSATCLPTAQGLFDKWLPSAVLRMPVTERWEVHAEWFGSWTDGLEDERVRPFVGPGTHFMITPNLEIGCRMGWGLTEDAAAYFVDSGLGWRF